MTNNSVFPQEILKKVFGYLTDPKDLYHTCQLICKSWNIATGISRKGFSVQLHDYQLLPFLNDLKRFLSMGPKILGVTMLPPCSGYKNQYNFQAMVNLCQNLSEIVFACSSVYEYVRGINSHEAKLPNIKKITLKTLKKCTPALKRFHLWINFRFRDTITHLEIFDLEHMGVLNKSDRLIQFSTSFKRLQNLRVQFQDMKKESVDLDSILSPNKEIIVLKLVQPHQVTANKENLTVYPFMQELEITVTKIASMHLFHCIIFKFPNLKKLRLIIDDSLSHHDLTEEESLLILENFTKYCDTIESVRVSYFYDGQTTQVIRNIRNQVYVLDEEDNLWDEDILFPEEFDEDFPVDIYEYFEHPSPPSMHDEYWDIEDFQDSYPPFMSDDEEYQEMMANEAKNPDYTDDMKEMMANEVTSQDYADAMQEIMANEFSSQDYADAIQDMMDEEVARQDYLDDLHDMTDEEIARQDYLDALQDMADDDIDYEQDRLDMMQEMEDDDAFYEQSYLDEIHNTSDGIDYLHTQDYLDSLQRMAEEGEYFMTQDYLDSIQNTSDEYFITQQDYNNIAVLAQQL